MTTKEFILNNGNPIQDIVAFSWLSPKSFNNDFKIPFQYFEHKNLEKGKACLGKVIAVGPTVEYLKPEDIFYFNEYEADTGMFLDENKVYFIEEKKLELKFFNKPKDWIFRS